MRRPTGSAGRPVTPVDWARFDRETRRLAASLLAAGAEVDLVLGINRGGAVSAVLLSHLLDVRDMLTFSLQMTADSSANADRADVRALGEAILPQLAGRRILLVDDAVGSGRTFELALDLLRPVAPASVITAATIWNREERTHCPADHFGGTTPGWVLFPWEPQQIPPGHFMTDGSAE